MFLIVFVSIVPKKLISYNLLKVKTRKSMNSLVLVASIIVDNQRKELLNGGSLSQEDSQVHSVAFMFKLERRKI